MAFEEIDIGKAMVFARDTTGKSLLGMVMDIARLSWTNGLTAAEYFGYGLYDDRRYSFQEKRRFLSDSRFAYYNEEASNRIWFGTTRDKLLNYAILGAHGIRIPKIFGLMHPYRVYPTAKCLRTNEELAAFLRDGMTYPFFQKPVSGVQSRTVSFVVSYDAASDELVHLDGTREGVDAYVDRMLDREGFGLRNGHLWQEVIRPHPEVEALTGARLNTVRIVVGVSESGPEILGCSWKIAVGENVADNFWREGNLLADFDLETGEIRRVVRGEPHAVLEAYASPDTGAKLVGAKLPMWDEARKVALDGAAIFPKIRLQGWDIALAEDGPVVLEVNSGSSFVMLQLGGQNGADNARFRDIVKFGRACNDAEGFQKPLFARIWRLLFGASG